MEGTLKVPEVSTSNDASESTTLQRSLDVTAWSLSVCAPFVATLELLKLIQGLGFYLDPHGNLGMGLHQSRIVQHTYAT